MNGFCVNAISEQFSPKVFGKIKNSQCHSSIFAGSYRMYMNSK